MAERLGSPGSLADKLRFWRKRSGEEVTADLEANTDIAHVRMQRSEFRGPNGRNIKGIHPGSLAPEKQTTADLSQIPRLEPLTTPET